MEALGQGLGLGRSHAVLEEAHGVRVRARLVEVQHQRDDVAARKPRAAELALPVGHKGAVAVKVDALGGVAHHQLRTRGGEADAHLVLGLRCVLGRLVLHGVHVLDDLQLEHVAAGLGAHARTRPRIEVLHAAIAERHEEPAVCGLHDVQRRVLHREVRGLLDARLCLLRRRVLLELLWRLGLLLLLRLGLSVLHLHVLAGRAGLLFPRLLLGRLLRRLLGFLLRHLLLGLLGGGLLLPRLLLRRSHRG
mmetsp:Transcript_52986/g.141938  ORF Transcript_52986/g.141938 Transcript_52986/m.141938 type:complete len:249 (-) Transcript_52986:81-827(-)